MRSHRWLIFLGVLALAVNPYAMGYDGQTVRFHLYGNYLVVAKGSVGSLKGLNFLVDTGTSPAVVDQHLAHKLHLQEQSVNVAVIGGSVPGGESVVPSLAFGPLRKDHLPVLVEDLSFFEKTFGVQIDAVIGLDVLGQSPFVIDYRSHEIHFGFFPALATSLLFHVEEGLPIVNGELDHVSARLLFDTGASSLILFGAPRDLRQPMKISVTIGEFERKRVSLQSLKLGDAEFGRESAFLVERRSAANRDFDGLMSPAALGITKVAIDQGRGILSFAR
jgi:predicted aspartyl protease